MRCPTCKSLPPKDWGWVHPCIVCVCGQPVCGEVVWPNGRNKPSNTCYMQHTETAHPEMFKTSTE